MLGAQPHHVLAAHRLLRQLPPAAGAASAASGSPRARGTGRRSLRGLPRRVQAGSGLQGGSGRPGERRPRRQRQQQEERGARAAAPDTSARRHLGSPTSGAPAPPHARRVQSSAPPDVTAESHAPRRRGGGRGIARPRPSSTPLIHAPSRPPLRGRAPFWARAPLGPNFLQGSVVTAIIAASGISAAPPPLPGSNHHQHHLHSPSHGMVWVRRDSRAGHACPQLPQPRAPAWASSPTPSWCCWQQKEGAVLRQAHTALAYQPMLSSGLGCGILLLIVAAEAPSRLSSWEWREAVVACPPTAHGKYPAL